MVDKRCLWIGSVVSILIIGLLVGCGPSAEEQAATSAALTAAAATDTPTPTPTDTPTPTATPVPYDLSLIVTGEEDVPIGGAHVVLEEAGDETGTQITDEVGQVIWYDLPGETVNLSISAQGYFPLVMTEFVERGINQMTVALERDPHGLLPSEACGPGEKLLYIEDFQDSAAEGWEEIELRVQGWDIGLHPDTHGDVVVIKPADVDGQTPLRGFTAENTVARVHFMPSRYPDFVVASHYVNEPYEFFGDTIEFSGYQVVLHPTVTRVFRQAEPLSTIWLGEVNRGFKTGEWHKLEIWTYEGILEIWIDDTRYLKYKDPKPLPGGTLLLEVWQSEAINVVYFDDISICELGEPYVPMPTPES